MSKLAVVSYLREGEQLTLELIEIGNQLYQRYPDFMMELFVDSLPQIPKYETDFPIRINHIKGTKYSKLLHALSRTKYNYLLSLDNDIEADIPTLMELVEKTIEGSYDLGWGRIHSRKVSGMVSRLVEVDKLLSHTILRPLLWRLGLGVTLPGQCFLLKTKSYIDRLPETDTFLDDLSIGLYSVKHGLRHYHTQEAVAFELPSYSFLALWRQRARWATGFRQSLACTTLERKDRYLLCIHAFFYHFLPLMHLLVLIIFFIKAPLIAVCWLSFIALAVSCRQPQTMPVAFMYPILFPVFHLGWLIYLFKRDKL